MTTKKSDSTAMFSESIEQVQKSMPADVDIEKIVFGPLQDLVK